MKKIHLFSALALGAVLAGCSNDELVDKSQLGNLNSDGRISFTQKVGNTTRADNRAETAGHYEFGVWGYKGAAADKVYTEGDVMTKYLVAYGDNTTGDANNNYKDLSGRATTYAPDANDGTTTVAPDGVSTWFYEGLGSPEGSHKEQTGTNADHVVPSAALQSLKYWDKSKDYHNFFAYMPYYGTQNTDQDVTIAAASSTGADITFSAATHFYTDPVAGAQVAKNTKFADQVSGNREKYNTEILNANEALYAAVSRSKSASEYEKDVPLKFQHVNAKIKVAIWEAIPGYKVELLDLVPSAISITGGTTAAYTDVALTPATKAQAIEHENKAQTTVISSINPQPTYPVVGTIKAASVQEGASGTDRATLSYTNTAGNSVDATTGKNANLRFTKASDMATSYDFRTETGVSAPKIISEVGGTSATVLNTTYYALPNSVNGTSFLTNSGSDNTGYTFHVTYRLLPEDGSAATTVYDARVWVAPDFCHWQDGKQYTYIFKITTSSNGTTDPNIKAEDIFTSSGETNPYVDPEDPRVPEDPALKPIVFDGVTIEDYTPEGTGHNNGSDDVDTWQISNVESWPAFYTGTKPTDETLYNYRYCNYLTNKDVYKGALDLSNEYYTTLASAPAVSGSPAVTFTGSGTYAFTYGNATFKPVTSGTKSFTAADLKTRITAGMRSFTNSATDAINVATIQEGITADQTFATYLMYIWSGDDASAAWRYTATPTDVSSVTVTPTLVKEVKTVPSDDSKYKRVETHTSITSPLKPIETKYYKANAAGTGWDEIDETTYKAASTTDGTATYAYTFKYTYSVAASGYTVTMVTTDGTTGKEHPSQAYGIVVKTTVTP